jgi:hypothetical protein
MGCSPTTSRHGGRWRGLGCWGCRKRTCLRFCQFRCNPNSLWVCRSVSMCRLRSRRPTAADPCTGSASSGASRRSPRPPRQSPPAHVTVGGPAAPRSRNPAPGRAGHSPSPPCNRRRTHVSSQIRSAIRLAVCRCFTGAVPSASKIASLTGSSSGPSFGLPIGFVRMQPGGSENRHNLATVSRLRPENRAASRWFLPSKNTKPRLSARRHTSLVAPKKDQLIHWQTFTPPRSAQCRRSSGWFCHRSAQTARNCEPGTNRNCGSGS